LLNTKFHGSDPIQEPKTALLLNEKLESNIKISPSVAPIDEPHFENSKSKTLQTKHLL